MHTKNYDTNVKKEWREQVWSYWRHISGRMVLPASLQYWTLSDVILDANYEPYGELAHIKEFGLLESDRSFYGVCNNKEKAMRNLPPCLHCGVAPKDHDKGPCRSYSDNHPWNPLYGDIARLVGEFHKHGAFRPGIINLDTTNGKDLGWELAASVGQYCVGHSGTVMILNLIKKHRGLDHSDAEILEEAKRYRCFRSATLHDPENQYQGGVNCQMRTVFLVW